MIDDIERVWITGWDLTTHYSDGNTNVASFTQDPITMAAASERAQIAREVMTISEEMQKTLTGRLVAPSLREVALGIAEGSI